MGSKRTASLIGVDPGNHGRMRRDEMAFRLPLEDRRSVARLSLLQNRRLAYYTVRRTKASPWRMRPQ